MERPKAIDGATAPPKQTFAQFRELPRTVNRFVNSWRRLFDIRPDHVDMCGKLISVAPFVIGGKALENGGIESCPAAPTLRRHRRGSGGQSVSTFTTDPVFRSISNSKRLPSRDASTSTTLLDTSISRIS
ncbi:hypothetical protein JM93_01469 [Roseibium hamelinense]|uniref:Uncharacterized protein n=1 Tax=Roseibium hamelinense TaxID=150831 RepID=A0A562T9W2_9HYPH|nr:hypothetical protein JM93_01469 [Roseibium hamelinense]